MAESNSFSSLLALVDNHLSKTSLQDGIENTSTSDDKSEHPGLSTPQRGSLNFPSQPLTVILPSVRLPIPSFSLSSTPIKTILAEQVANMLKAKEEKLKGEELKNQSELTTDLNKDFENSHIDLMQALRIDLPTAEPLTSLETINKSVSSSLESLLEPKFTNFDMDTDTEKSVTPEPINLPCVMDMSFILNKKINRGKCSNFGKVVTSRYRLVAAPYFRTKYPNNILPFDFSKKSPCDLIKEKLRKPCTFNHNV